MAKASQTIDLKSNSEAAKVANSYITAIDNNGIKVHAANNVNSNYTQIDANGMTVYKDGEQKATFGTESTIGNPKEGNVYIDNDSFIVSNNDGIIFDVEASDKILTTENTINLNNSVIGTDNIFKFGDGKTFEYDLTQSTDTSYSIRIRFESFKNQRNNYNGTNYDTTIAAFTADSNTVDTSSTGVVSSFATISAEIQESLSKSANFSRTYTHSITFSKASAVNGNTVVSVPSGTKLNFVVNLSWNYSTKKLTVKFNPVKYNTSYVLLGNVHLQVSNYTNKTKRIAPYFTLGTRTIGNDFGGFSTTIGDSLIAEENHQLVVGKYNNKDDSANKIFVVGAGTETARKNSFSVSAAGIESANYYPVNSVYVGCTPENPSKILGFGDWTLLRKEPPRREITSGTIVSWNDEYTRDSSSTNKRSFTILTRSDYVWVRLQWYNKVAFSDETATICTIDLSQIGISSTYGTYTVGQCDGANAVLDLYASNANGGVVTVTCRDAVTRAASYPTTTNAICQAVLQLQYGNSAISDSYMNQYQGEYHWIRTA